MFIDLMVEVPARRTRHQALGLFPVASVRLQRPAKTFVLLSPSTALLETASATERDTDVIVVGWFSARFPEKVTVTWGNDARLGFIIDSIKIQLFLNSIHLSLKFDRWQI
jgi:hypothetical protein